MRSFRKLLTASAMLLLVAVSTALAQPQQSEQDKGIIRIVSDILVRANVTRPKFDEDFSKRVFANFFKSLDPFKYIFLKSDLDEFRKYETTLGNDLRDGEGRFAFEVFQRYLARRAECLKIVEEFTANPVDFTAQETLATETKLLDYPKDEVERKSRLQRVLKLELLRRKFEPQAPAEPEARRKLLVRWKDINRSFARFDSSDLLEVYLTAASSSIDPHSSYMNAKNLEDMLTQGLQLNVEGIGARLRTEDDTPTIEEIVPGGPADKDGRLKPGDRIVSVANGDSKFQDIIGMKLQEAVRLIRGPKGTRVELKVIPSGKSEAVVYVLTRDKVLLKDAQARTDIIEQGTKPDGSPFKIGVISLPSFYGDSGREAGSVSATADVRRFLGEFKEKKVDAVLLDLRGNPGGLLHEAVELAGLFVDEGTIVQVKGLDGRIRRHNDPEKGIAWDGPVVVATDRTSASAAEILAGAIQDFRRGLVVGDTTFGKGTVQSLAPIGDENTKMGGLKLTIQVFYRSNGVSTQFSGIAPDVSMPSLWQAMKIGERHLDNAVAVEPVASADPVDHGYTSDAIRKDVAAKSSERIKKSPDFQKLTRQIDALNHRDKFHEIPLKEDQYKEYRKKFGADEDNEEPREERKRERGFDPKDPVNRELIAIVSDYAGLLAKSGK